MIGSWPTEDPKQEQPLTDAERIAQLEQEVAYLKAPKRPEPHVVFSSPLGRLFKLKTSR